MIYAHPSATATATFDGFDTGLQGTAGVRILDDRGNVITARTTAGIGEHPAGSGSYQTTITSPDVDGFYVVVFDDGTATPTGYTAEGLTVNVTAAAEPTVQRDEVDLVFTGFDTGLTGIAGYTIENVAARTTIGVREAPTGSGIYLVTFPAPVEDGDFRVTFDDGSGTYATETITVGSSTGNTGDYTPSVDDVGALIRSRTRDSHGNELGTFTDDTRPTAAQVEKFITSAVAKVSSKIGGSIPPALVDEARDVIALRAAMYVEQSLFADQITAGRSPYAELKDMYVSGLIELVADWKNIGSDGLPGTVDDGPLPVGIFPPLGPTPRADGSETANDLFRMEW